MGILEQRSWNSQEDFVVRCAPRCVDNISYSLCFGEFLFLLIQTNKDRITFKHFYLSQILSLGFTGDALSTD
jgi:hypothetical protein